MLCLRQALKALLSGALDERSSSEPSIAYLEGFWHKSLSELSPQELAYVLAFMVEVGTDLNAEEKRRWVRGFLRENPVVVLLEEEAV